MIRKLLYRVHKRSRRILNSAAYPWRRATIAWRPLPSALIIGAQKGGTTSLHYFLGQHPGIASSFPKEVYFFFHNYARGADWYRTAFPMSHDGRIGLESTPGYLLHPHVPERVRSTLPRVKIIAMLRDPVTRAFSGWRHMRQAGYDDLPFEEAVDREGERTDAAWARLLADPDAPPWPFFYHTYLRRGRYAEQLRPWYDRFPREDILLIRSEDFFADPQAVVDQVSAWLGLPPRKIRDMRPRNTGHDRSRLDPAVAAKLRRYFEPHNQDLLRLTGRDFTW